MSLTLAKGIRGSNGKTFNVYGEPIPNNLSSEFFSAGLEVPYSGINSTNLFDVSSLTENHEVVAAIYDVSATINSRVDFTFNWYRKRDNLKIFSYSSYISSPPEGTEYGGFGATGWIGWLSYWDQGVWTYPEFKEIQENGDYYVEFTSNGGYSEYVKSDFTVTGIPADWHIWDDTVTSNGFDYTIRFSTRFQTSNYIRAGLCTGNFTNGQTTAPSGIISETVQYAPSGEGQGCGVEGYVTSLNSSTSYTIYAFAQATNGQYYKIGSRTVTTKGGIPHIPSSAPIGDRIEGGFSLSWGSSNGATSYTVSAVRLYDGYVTTKTFYSTSGTLTGLQYGVTYGLSVRANNSYGSSIYTTANNATTAPKTPSITQGTTTTTSVDISVNTTMEGNFDEIQIERYSSSSVYIDTKFVSKSHYDAGNRTVTWSGLTQGGTFIFKARTKYNINSTDIYSVNYSNGLTVTVNAKPTPWKWTTASDSDGYKIPNDIFSMNYQEWNNFTQKINAFMQYKLGTTTTFTTAISGQPFTATHFNQAKNAIGGMNPTGISDKVPGNPVNASDLNTLMDKLNSIT